MALPDPPSPAGPAEFTLGAPGGLAIRVAALGATWRSCRVPMPDGRAREVLLDGPLPPPDTGQRFYLGATIGRYANRIAGATMVREGRARALVPNAGSRHQLHGGPDGFDRRPWSVVARRDDELQLSLVSPDGDQGFPGRLEATVRYRLLAPDTVEIAYEANVDAPCPVCLTNHAYFNLDGAPGSPATDVRAHALRIAASRFLPVDRELIPLGPLAAVDGTGFDFRRPRPIGEQWLADAQQQASAGYDHAFLFDASGPAEAAQVELASADHRLRLQLSTSLPALQLYTGQALGGAPRADGGVHVPCGGVALEPQFLPDSPNHPEWPQPDVWLQPGQTWRHWIRYRFESA